MASAEGSLFDLWDEKKNETSLVLISINPLDKTLEWRPAAEAKDDRPKAVLLSRITEIQMGTQLQLQRLHANGRTSLSISATGSPHVVLHLQARSDGPTRADFTNALLGAVPRAVLFTYDKPRSGSSGGGGGGGGDLVVKAPAADLDELKQAHAQYEELIKQKRLVDAQLSESKALVETVKATEGANFQRWSLKWQQAERMYTKQIQDKDAELATLRSTPGGGAQVSSLLEKIEGYKRQVAELKARDSKEGQAAAVTEAALKEAKIQELHDKIARLEKEKAVQARELDEALRGLESWKKSAQETRAAGEAASSAHLHQSLAAQAQFDKMVSDSKAASERAEREASEAAAKAARENQEAAAEAKRVLEATQRDAEIKFNELKKEFDALETRRKEEFEPQLRILQREKQTWEDQRRSIATAPSAGLALAAAAELKSAQNSEEKRGVDPAQYAVLQTELELAREDIRRLKEVELSAEGLIGLLETNRRNVNEATEALAASDSRLQQLTKEFNATTDELRREVARAKAETLALAKQNLVEVKVKGELKVELAKEQAALLELKAQSRAEQVEGRLSRETKLLTDLANTSKELDVAKLENATLTKQLSDANASVARLTSEIRRNEDQYKSERKLSGDAYAESQRLTTVLQAKIAANITSLQLREQELADSKNYQKAREAQLAALQEELKKSEQALTTSNEKLRRLEASIGQAEGDAKRFSAEAKHAVDSDAQLATLRGELKTAQNTVIMHFSQINHLEGTIRSLTQGNQKLQEDVSSSLTGLASQMKGFAEDLKSARGEVAAPSLEVSSLRKQVSDITSETEAKLDAARKQHEVALAAATAEVKDLQRQLAAAQAQLVQAQSEAVAASKIREDQRRADDEKANGREEKLRKEVDEWRTRAEEAKAQVTATHSEAAERIRTAVATADEHANKQAAEIKTVTERELGSLRVQLETQKALVASADARASVESDKSVRTAVLLEQANASVRDLQIKVANAERAREQAVGSLLRAQAQAVLSPGTPGASLSFESKASLPSSGSSGHLSSMVSPGSTSRTTSRTTVPDAKTTAPIVFTVQASSLPTRARGTIDPLAVLLLRNPANGVFESKQRSTVLSDTKSPQWGTRFEIPAGTIDDFKICIFDKESSASARQGFVQFSSASFGATGGALIPLTEPAKPDQEALLKRERSEVTLTLVR